MTSAMDSVRDLFATSIDGSALFHFVHAGPICPQSSHGPMLETQVKMETKYPPQVEWELVQASPEIREQIRSAKKAEHLMPLALKHGLYYLFKYLYMVEKVPLSLKAYTKLLNPSTRTGLEEAFQALKVTVLPEDPPPRTALAPTTFPERERIKQLFEQALMRNSLYENHPAGYRWVFCRKIADREVPGPRTP